MFEKKDYFSADWDFQICSVSTDISYQAGSLLPNSIHIEK